MGQKIHPNGFRLGINQYHQSSWFSKRSLYSKVLAEDYYLREYIMGLFPNISKIQIYRGFNDSIQLTLYLLKPIPIINQHNRNINNLRVKLENVIAKYRQSRVSTFLPFERCFDNKHPKITIHVIEYSHLDALDVDASSLAYFLVEQLQSRIPFRKAMKKTLRRAQKAKIKGIKICVSGRLNGAEIARSEWIRNGQVPLQTLRAEIKYCYKIANTIYGTLGIKIWILKK